MAPHHLYLFKETIELSYYTIYCLVVVYPIVTRLIHYFLSRAARVKSSSSTASAQPTRNNVTWTHSLGSIAGFLLLALAAFRFMNSSSSSGRNVYDILNVRRQDSIYTIAKKYVTLKKAFQSGKVSETEMKHIDAAYDVLYQEQAKLQYDTWGPQASQASRDGNDSDALLGLNLMYFYFIWALVAFSCTRPKGLKGARTWAISGLLFIFGYDFAIRIFEYELYNPTPYYTTLTSFELLLGLQFGYPLFLYFTMAYKRLFYIDSMVHRNQVLLDAAANSNSSHAAFVHMRTLIEEQKNSIALVDPNAKLKAVRTNETNVSRKRKNN